MATKTAVAEFQIADDLVLPAGRYVKVSDRRIGTAYLEISDDGDLTYTNRNGEVIAVTLTRFRSLYLAGMSVPQGTASVAGSITRAPRV